MNFEMLQQQKALPLNLSDNCLEQAHFNAVFYQIKEMDWVGVEPTT
jgi:hypothetical protein